MSTGAGALRRNDQLMVAGADGQRGRAADAGTATGGARRRQGGEGAPAAWRPTMATAARHEREAARAGWQSGAASEQPQRTPASSVPIAKPVGSRTCIGVPMSIPRLAIHRPVTMFMISFVVILLGAISLTRLPVDLMPESEFPSITVRVNYSGVGPLEMEELVTRPIEQAVSAIAGLEQVNSTSSEGNSNVRLQFAWGTDLNEAADEVRTRVDRVRGRMPEDADPPTVFKFDSNSMPIMGIGVEGDYDPVTLRELAQNDLSPRLERVEGVASVTIDGGLRRQIHVDLSRERSPALNLSVDRITQVAALARTRTSRSARSRTPIAAFLLRSPGQFTSLDDVKNLIIMTRDGVPVYLKDIAEVSDSTEDRRSVTRINGRPGIRMRVQKQSGKNTVQVAERCAPRSSASTAKCRASASRCSTISRSSSRARSTACRSTR